MRKLSYHDFVWDSIFYSSYISGDIHSATKRVITIFEH